MAIIIITCLYSVFYLQTKNSLIDIFRLIKVIRENPKKCENEENFVLGLPFFICYKKVGKSGAGNSSDLLSSGRDMSIF